MLSFVTVCSLVDVNPSSGRGESLGRISRQRDGGVGSTVALNRVLFNQNEVSENGWVIVPKTDYRATHIEKVLRLPRSGGTVRAGVVDGFIVDDVPIFIDDCGTVTFDLSSGQPTKLPRPPSVSLILAVPRPKVLARLLPQIAAIGVKHLVLCNAFKVEKCYFDSKLLQRPSETRALLLEGVAQCGNDCRLPTVTIERRLKVFLEDRLQDVAGPNADFLIAEPGSEVSILETILSPRKRPSHPNGSRQTILAIGPEGGWMPRELNMFKNSYGFRQVSLGDRILRTDAAVLILLGLANEHRRFMDQHRQG